MTVVALSHRPPPSLASPSTEPRTHGHIHISARKIHTSSLLMSTHKHFFFSFFFLSISGRVPHLYTSLSSKTFHCCKQMARVDIWMSPWRLIPTLGVCYHRGTVGGLNANTYSTQDCNYFLRNLKIYTCIYIFVDGGLVFQLSRKETGKTASWFLVIWWRVARVLYINVCGMLLGGHTPAWKKSK